LDILIPNIIVILFLLPLIDSNFIKILIGIFDPKKEFFTNWNIFSIFITAAIIILLKYRTFKVNKWYLTTLITLLYLFLISLQISSWRLIGINQIDTNVAWSGHLDPIIFSISQVVSGKTILVDFPSQYGLYSEMLGPIFKIFNLSVFSITLIFALMQIFSLFSLYYVLYKLIKNKLILIFSSVSLIMVTFGSCALIANHIDPYFQYWPIRFFFPAISILLFLFFSEKSSLINSVIFSVFSAIGVLWNFDTGIVIFIAYSGFLSARIAISFLSGGRISFQNGFYLKAIGLHILVHFLVIVFFLWVLHLKSHGNLNYYWLIKYQSIFYNLGYFMLPLPVTLHPWMSIMGIYAISIITSFLRMFIYKSNKKSDLLFYIGLLGIGLFSYYQGRSHDLVLAAVVWPSIILIAIFTDEITRAIKLKILKIYYMPIVFIYLSILIILSVNFIINIPYFYARAVSQYSNWYTPTNKLVNNELSFIRSHSIKNSECLILSSRQGIYYAETGLHYPLKSSGWIEIILQADVDNLRDNILSGKLQCIFLGIGKNTDPGNIYGIKESDLINKYDIKAINSDNSMLFLMPKR
jgi:hypothetical protein